MNSKISKTVMALSAIILMAGTMIMVNASDEMKNESLSRTPAETDSQIESSAMNSYVFKTYLKNDEIEIQSLDGHVKLKGHVSESEHRILAQDTVVSLPGVKSVDNQLIVKTTAPSENSDEWIKIKVKTSLLFHRLVNLMKTEVEVKDGIVTLKGDAQSESQKELTGKYVNEVNGVKEVRNEMTVTLPAIPPEKTLGEKIDDASITAQVKWSLLSTKSTSALKTGVTTNNGEVTLTGKAKDLAEKELVSLLVMDIKGVTKVINNMTIGEKIPQ